MSRVNTTHLSLLESEEDPELGIVGDDADKDTNPRGDGELTLDDDKAPLLKLTHNDLKSDKNREEVAPGTSITKLDIKRLLGLVRPEWARFTIAMVALVISSGTMLVVPSIMGDVIDSVLNPENSKFSLSTSVVILFSVFMISSVFTFVRTYAFQTAGEQIVATLRKTLFKAITSQEIGFFDVTRTGELINRLSSDTSVIQSTVTSNISMGLRFGLQAIGGVFVLFYISWKLTLVMFAMFPLIGLASWAYGRYIRTLSKDVQEKLADAATVAEEAISSIRTVRSFCGESKEVERYDLKVQQSFDSAKRRAFVEGVFQAAVTLLANVGIAGVLWYGGGMVVSGELSAGTLTSFILYTLTVGVSFGALSSLYGDIMKAVGASERVFQLIDRVPSVRFSGGRSMRHVDGNVDLVHVDFAYPSRIDKPVLKNLSLSLKPGKVVALVGPSGQGKSTIAHLIEGFYLPENGKVLLDGFDTKDLDPKFLRKNIAIVSQEPSLFACTIAENIAYGASDEDFANDEDKKLKIIEAAKLANAHDFIVSFPEGYNTVLGERGVRTSGGEKQRIAIARALLKNPRILLLDEATSALDSESEYLVKKTLDDLLKSAQERTILVIAHRLSTVKNADEVAVVLKGSIVERGTHDELLAKGGVYSKLVARQLMQT